MSARAAVSTIHEDTYRRLVDSLADYAICMLDGSGTVLTWNLGAERLTGYTHGDIVGQPFSRLYAAGEAPYATADAFDQERRFRGTRWYVRKDGSRFAAGTLISPVASAGGTDDIYAVVLENLAEGDQGVTAGHLYRLLVHSVRDYAIFMLDAAGYVVTWNEGARRLKGYTSREIVGEHFSKFYPHEAIDARWPWRELEFAAAEGRFEDEGWRLRKDGTQFWANVVITALRDSSGRLLGYSKVTRDLTERKAAEEALRESEERYRLLVAGVRDYAIFMLDPLGYVLTWNEGAERIKGYSAADIIGEHFSKFYPADAVATRWPWKELEAAAAEGRFEDEGWRVRKDGSQFWANVVITAVRNNEGRIVGFTKVTRDLTERRKSEQQIRALNQELQSRVIELAASNREVQQKSAENEAFVYGVSHDVRSPLVNLQGFSQEMKYAAEDLRSLLDRESVAPDIRERAHRIIDEGIAASVKHVQTAVLHLSNIVDGLLRLSRAGKIVYQSTSIPLSPLVHRIITSLHSTINARGAQFVIEDLPTVYGDPAALEQLFSNLISNALNYLDPAREGRIRIGSLPPQGDRAIVFIRDNGAGLSAAAHAKLFQVFQRFHPQLSPGEGMGLAIAQRIIERHNGRIWAESNPGEGTTFYLALPSLAADAGSEQ